MLPKRYEIHIRGPLPEHVLAELRAAHPTLEVQTVMSGRVRDQAELQGLLRRIHHHGPELLEMRQVPDPTASRSADLAADQRP